MISGFIFLAFLVVYVIYIWTSTKLLAKAISARKGSFLQSELMIILPNLFLFGCVFIIGRFFNLHLLLMSILFSNIGLLLAFIIWNLLGSPKVPYKAVGAWAGFCFGVNNGVVMGTTLILSLLIAIAYPVFIGIYFFRGSSPEEVRLLALAITTVMILGSYVLLLPTVVNSLSSAFIDEDSRARYLVTQFTNLIPNSLFISLLFWTFNMGKADKQIAVGNVNMSFDPLLFTILMAFFVFFLLLPYFIGIQRSKQMKDGFFEEKHSILEELIEAIDLATPATVVPRLEETEKLVQKKYDELVEDNAALQRGLELDKHPTSDTVDPAMLTVYDNYKLARSHDKRFVYYDFLNGIFRNVNELVERIKAEPDAAVNKETLKAHSAYYKDLRKEITDVQGKKTSNPALWIGILAIISPFISQIITEIGKWMIAYLNQL